jgi:2-oxoglutarate ferredoxin oxidoreductase subunit beta
MIEGRIAHSDTPLTKDEFVSGSMVKWCPGCGDYSILSCLTQAMARTGYRKEDILLVSGIGCSSRIPYYVNTYGFHSIHGRAAAIASGAKSANPDLSVWMATGDGDCAAIGGNHFIHILRRNVDVNIILFNNHIYGLTKGQYSPTTPMGTVTKTSPFGTIERPFNPAELALGAGATFFARVPDNNPKLMTDCMEAAAAHDGTSVIEVLQNCMIFANKAHYEITARETRDDRQLILEDGQPMLFGKDKEKGLRLNGLQLEVVEIGKNGVRPEDILVHHAQHEDPVMHMMLSRMALPDLPVAMGILRSVKQDTYDDLLEAQINEQKSVSKIRCMDDLLNSGDVFYIS